MKKRLFILLLGSIGMSAPSFAQSSTAGVDAKVKFKEELINFGTTKPNKPVTATFEFTNISKEPLLIEFARASCGCTTPDWTKEPILPGKTGKVMATYAANQGTGQVSKTIWVKFKGIDQDKELHLSGKVEASNQ